eukprot:366089-Chlamydomonas_euryale.AAC.6
MSTPSPRTMSAGRQRAAPQCTAARGSIPRPPSSAPSAAPRSRRPCCLSSAAPSRHTCGWAGPAAHSHRQPSAAALRPPPTHTIAALAVA